MENENPLRQYPSSIDEILDDTIKYRREVVKAMNKFKSFEPWKGTPFQRAAKLSWLHLEFCKIYGVDTKLTFDPDILCDVEQKSGNGWWDPELNMIHISGKVSILTFLHEWGHNLHGESEFYACWWSINLFRKIFPQNFNKLRNNARGHFLTA